MKKYITLFFVVLIVWTLALTKPTMASYVDWTMNIMRQDLQQESTDVLTSTINGLGLKWFGPTLIESSTTVRNYCVYDVFETNIDGRSIKVLGIFNQFIPLETTD